MFEDFFFWWGRQMASLLSPVTARFAARIPDALLIALDPARTDSVQIVHRRNARLIPAQILSMSAETGVWRDALAARGRREPVIVALSTGFLLRRVALPIAAAANLERVLRYEMDRLTPFADEDVVFSHAVTGHDRARGQLGVELSVAPKAWFSAVVDRLIAADAAPATLEAAGPDGRTRCISLSHAAPSRVARGLNRFGWIACGVLAVAVSTMPLMRQSLALAEVEDRIAALRPRVEQAEALRKRIAANTSGAGQIATARRQASEALRTLALLTDLLPDDTWLISLHLHDHKATLEGQSAAATKLIGALAAEPALKNPAFAAPVVRAETGADIFTIQAEFGP